ncbi:MAG: ABC transporter permease [Lachnospiraceae bacterium]|nr:ABC transporter permease [Lachnospiraceae bacterium]MBR6349738.1 ABC transporter permease [Lachnospiraceae bacterium]
MKKILRKISPILVILGLLIIWELVVRIAGIPSYVLPAPTKIIQALFTDIKAILHHSLVTVLEALIGMAISFVVAIVFGIIMDALPGFKRCIYPILVVTQTIPIIVLAPILVIYMGFGWGPKILTVVLMCFFPIVVSFSDGLAQMDAGYVNLIRTYGGTKAQVYRYVKLPSAFMSLVSGLKVAATYSISGAVVGEWIASSSGLGYYLIRAKNSYLMDKVFASVLVIIILSLLMNGLVKLFGYLFVPGARKKAKH